MFRSPESRLQNKSICSDVNWGSSTQAHSYRNALNAMHRLQLTEEHVKNYRPQILVLCGNPVARPSLIDLASKITKEQSLLICGHVIVVLMFHGNA